MSFGSPQSPLECWKPATARELCSSTSRVTDEFSIVRAARSDTDCNTSLVTVDVTMVRAARNETEPNTIVLSITIRLHPVLIQ